MSTEMSIFKQQDTKLKEGRELSSLAQSLKTAGPTIRRIQTNTNGTFKCIVGGEQVGDAVRGEINLIIIGALAKVSRVFYKEKYDPDKDATLPNCWSNLGDKPEEASSDKQHANCTECPQNVAGSGDNGGRACRYQRRLAVLVEGDTSGMVYQFNVPAKSLFGKGVGNVHPFESYIRYLLNNGESPDNVVTNVAYDLNADTMELQFTPLRNINDDEYAIVTAAQLTPEATSYTKLTVAQADNVAKLPPNGAAKDEPEDKTSEPVKRKSKKNAAKDTKADLAATISVWASD